MGGAIGECIVVTVTSPRLSLSKTNLRSTALASLHYND